MWRPHPSALVFWRHLFLFEAPGFLLFYCFIIIVVFCRLPLHFFSCFMWSNKRMSWAQGSPDFGHGCGQWMDLSFKDVSDLVHLLFHAVSCRCCYIEWGFCGRYQVWKASNLVIWRLWSMCLFHWAGRRHVLQCKTLMSLCWPPGCCCERLIWYNYCYSF